MSEITVRSDTYLANTYAHFPVEIVSGKGSLLYDESGKEYIDLGSGIAVNSFGVADEAWMQAVTAQLGKVAHTSNLYYTEPCGRLAEMLCERSGMKKVFFGNSGAEANECAIKAARKYASDVRNIGMPVIATLKNSFHGRTITTLAATGQEHYHEMFQPLTSGFVHVTPGNVEELYEAARNNQLAAIMVECVQGEGGVIPLSQEYAQAIQKVCHDSNILLIVDEVQTGIGRSGKFFAYQKLGMEPDIVTTAKGLGGGLPIGACLLGEKVKGVFHPGDHGSTFGGNPAVAAGAISVVERLTEDFLAGVERRSQMIWQTLSGKPGIRGVSGMGLMVGIDTEKPAPQVLARARENGVLCLTAKSRVRLLPALNIPDELLMRALEVLCDAADPNS